ncbi:MAG: hypothetical protein HOP96_11900 [Sphingomonas sp.]|nr:hypothetical protein [Sphingomonas sp.]
MLVVQAAISLILFARVQGLFGPQHFYLLVPAAGIGIAAAVIGIWDRARNVAWRAAGIGAILAALVASSVAALSPVRASGAPLLPRNLYPPLVRPDLAEIDRLLNALQGLRPERVYVVSSSETLNWDTLQSACRPKRLELCKHLAVTADIDTRDGFPRPVMEADTLVLATPTQFHVRPEDQQVVGLIARDIREGRGIGTSFERLPEAFTLRQGVKVEMYRRARSLRPEDVKALSDELIRSYPKQKALFAL